MKKKVLSFMLALAMCLGLTVPAAAASGTMYIGSAADLLAFGEQLKTNPSLNGTLTADINLDGISWEHPLAYTAPYTGTFDGSGHTISNLSGSNAFIGAIGIGGVVQNLTLADISLSGTDSEGIEVVTNQGYKAGWRRLMGGLADVNYGDILNCTVSGSIDSAAHYVGGIAAEMIGGSLVNCQSYVDITFRSGASAAHCGAGGLVGSFSSTRGEKIALIDQCQFHGSISASGPVPGCGVRVGGIVAEPGIYGLIINCVNTGCITADVWKASDDDPALIGGIVGDTVHTFILNCANTGTIYVKSKDLSLGCNGLDGGCSWLAGVTVGCSNSWSSGSVGGESPLGDAGQYGDSTSYFLEGTNFNAGNSPTFTRTEMTDGTLVNKLNEYVAQNGDLPIVRQLCENESLTMRDCRLLTWVQGPNGPELSTSSQVFQPTAYAYTQTITIDGRPVQFQCYALKDANGNQTNYVKLRDVASLLDGTAAQFNVGWNGAVNIETGRSYVPNGTELSTPFTGDRTYQTNPAETRVNGAAADLAAILLTDDSGGGHTYYQLRALGQALGFNVGWTAARGIFIETDKPYSD